MSQLMNDPELDELVHALNRGRSGDSEAIEVDESQGTVLEGSGPEPSGQPARSRLDRPGLGRVQAGSELEDLLEQVIRRGASDLHLISGLPPVVRIDGGLQRLDRPPVDGGELGRWFQAHLGQRGARSLEEAGSADLTLRLAPGDGEAAGSSGGERGAWRFRANLHRQRGALAAAIRALPREIPALADLHLPEALSELVQSRRGLVLVCGPTGAGKSSTLAALVGELNRSRSLHIVTIEDPVEFTHPSRRSVVEQVEIGRDAPSFAQALKAALRQDPDVILVGEMRDLESIRMALTAAETGHLVLSTLHTLDSAQAIHRMIDVFPGDQQAQIRHQLALSLHAIVTQQLVPRLGGGRVPAVEILRATTAVRHLIRSDQLHKLPNEITLGKRLGMVSLEESLADLTHRGVIDPEEAQLRTARPHELRSLLTGSSL